jgi:hypothetical protein
MSGSNIKPWQIIVLIVAALVVLWRVGAYTMEVRKTRDVKEVKGEFKNPAKPGSKTYQMFEEK